MEKIPASSSEVDEFLQTLRDCLESGRYTLVPRDQLNVMSLGGHHGRACSIA